MTKTCTKCKQVKELALFSKQSVARDGLQPHCKVCKLDYQRACITRNAVSRKYWEANKEVCSERVSVSVAKKKDYYRAKQYEWVANNKERHLEVRRAWYAKNSSGAIEASRRYFGYMRGAKVSPAFQAEIDGMYLFCNIFNRYAATFAARLEVDHVIPLNGDRVSGLHTPLNLQILTCSENRSKGSKYNISEVLI